MIINNNNIIMLLDPSLCRDSSADSKKCVWTTCCRAFEMMGADRIQTVTLYRYCTIAAKYSSPRKVLGIARHGIVCCLGIWVAAGCRPVRPRPPHHGVARTTSRYRCRAPVAS